MTRKKIADDVEAVIDEIRENGSRLIDEFITLCRSSNTAGLAALEELKQHQYDAFAALDEIKEQAERKGETECSK